MIRRPMILFYVMAFYIFASYIWWMFLLIQKNNELFSAQTELMKLSYIHQNMQVSDMFGSTAYAKITEKHKAQNFMVFGESIVFLLLIFIGTFQIRRGYMQEIN